MSEITLSKPNSALQWLQLRLLYRSAFPPAERKPFRIITRMYRQGKTDIWCITEKGRFVGFASTINGGELVLLDYLAVSELCRGRGIGSAAMGRLQELYRDKGLFVEIESTLIQSPDQSRRQKRKCFYRAAGMEEFHVEAEVFGVRMELLGSRCRLDFEGYQQFYRTHYSDWAAKHILRTK